MSRPDPSLRNASAGLTSAQFHILLALSDGARHGYGIMQEVERKTDGALELGPGTLYRSIKQLLDRGLIVEIGERSQAGRPPPKATGPGKQRRSYELTEAGRVQVAEEARRLQALVQWAEDALAPEGGLA